MTKRGLRHRWASFLRIALLLIAILTVWPALHTARLPEAQASSASLTDLAQPVQQDLQAAFAIVGQGLVPSGYPQSSDGWLVPSSLLKAVAWTESGWRQFVSPSRTLVSYDGGFGLMQITSGMEDGVLPAVTRSAIANNFLYNLAFGAQVLVQKLMHTPNIGNDDPAILEHWYYALWAYNGWGWVNNPNNPAFSRMGSPATNPTAFPYQERVFYWLAHPPRGADGAPLWPSIPVTLPAPDAIGANPDSLPEVPSPHTDVAVPAPILHLSTESKATFLADSSVPDGTVLAPSQRFRKVWQLRNTGSTVWTAGYHWAPVGGPDLHASSIQVESTPPLADVSVSADLIAPSQPGEYREFWQMVGPDERPFGVRAWVDIQVRGTRQAAPPAVSTAPPVSAASDTGSADPTPSRANVITAEGTPAVAPASLRDAAPGTNLAIYAGDASVPDGTVFHPGDHFVKTWHIRNIGTTTWQPTYHWHFEAGTMLAKITSVSVPTTSPGAVTTISVPMIAPLSTGVYTSFWQMTDDAGIPFPHQAWVNIVVRGAPPTVVPTRTKATLTPTPTATHIPPTPLRPSPTAARATATATTVAPAQPTVDLPGGGGQLVASPWVGALAYRSYFPAGSTANGIRETLAIYFPGPKLTHVRVTLYRPDGAQRILQFALQSRALRVIQLNRVATGTGLAVTVEADRRVVTNRVEDVAGSPLADPGAARTARTWLFPAVPTGVPANQQLLLFNPHDQPAQVSIRVGRQGGGCCSSTASVSVPPLQQMTYRLGTSAALLGPISLFASSVVAAERIMTSRDSLHVVAVPGSVSPARQWYLPVIHTSPSDGSISLFNPGAKTIRATVHLALDEGGGDVQQRTIPPFSAVEIPVPTKTGVRTEAAEVTATEPILAGAVWHAANGAATMAVGSAASTRSWTLIAGIAGPRVSETVDVINPSTAPTTVEFHLAGNKRGSATWHIVMPAHSRYSRVLDDMVSSSGASVVIQATLPVAVGHTFTEAGGSATSLAFALPSP